MLRGKLLDRSPKAYAIVARADPGANPTREAQRGGGAAVSWPGERKGKICFTIAAEVGGGTQGSRIVFIAIQRSDPGGAILSRKVAAVTIRLYLTRRSRFVIVIQVYMPITNVNDKIR